jgi:hypothetical protein
MEKVNLDFKINFIVKNKYKEKMKNKKIVKFRLKWFLKNKAKQKLKKNKEEKEIDNKEIKTRL